MQVPHPRPALKRLLPRGFYARAVLIVLVPILVVVLVLSVVFVQRHYERVTRQMTDTMLASVALMIARVDAAPDGQAGVARVAELSEALGITVTPGARPPGGRADSAWYDLAGREVLRELRAAAPGFLAARLLDDPKRVALWSDTRNGPVRFDIPRARLTANNPHQLLVIVVSAAVLMALLALQYLRLQIRPIRALGAAAEAYGLGRQVALRPAGAREIRAAGLAFLDMRNRIERQGAQRKLMLSGLGHDMRTLLTRMRLVLSMMDDTEDRAALEAEIADLEALLARLRDYASGEAQNDPEVLADPSALIRAMVARHESAGQRVETLLGPGLPQGMRLREGQLERALDNVLSNALRHGSQALVTTTGANGWLTLTIEDDGPGIPAADRARACEPFVRLDTARNMDGGGSVGLGLAIARDIARGHGGTLALDESTALGGLKVVMRLPLGSHSA